MAATGGAALPGFSIAATVCFSAAFDEPTIAQAEAWDCIVGNGDRAETRAQQLRDGRKVAVAGLHRQYVADVFGCQPGASL